MKTGVTYTPHRAAAGKPSALTPEMMHNARNNAAIIDTIRDEISESLRQGGRLEFKSNRRKQSVSKE
jgi:hypothetical protein